MKKIFPVLLILILVFSGCAPQEEINNSSFESSGIPSSNESTSVFESSDESENNDFSSYEQVSNSVVNSSKEQTSSTVSSDVSSSAADSSREQASSITVNSSSSKPSPNTSSSNTQTSSAYSSPSSSQTNVIVEKNQVHLYTYESDRGWVILSSFDYKEGDTWSALLKNHTEISIDTTYDTNFNTIEYLKYNGKAITLNNSPVKKGDVISKKNIYKLSTLAGPTKINATTMYDLINVEHAHNNISYRSWSVRKYVINETSKTTGTIVMSFIEVREYSEPDEAFNGTIVVEDTSSVTYTYTSEYGLYAGKTIELNDGSKILLGTDMYWFYLGSSNTKRVLCDDYRAYKSVPNDPNDSYWNLYWSQLN